MYIISYYSSLPTLYLTSQYMSLKNLAITNKNSKPTAYNEVLKKYFE